MGHPVGAREARDATGVAVAAGSAGVRGVGKDDPVLTRWVWDSQLSKHCVMGPDIVTVCRVLGFHVLGACPHGLETGS